MPRLEKARRPMATLDRRALLAAAPAVLLAGCGDKMPTTVSTTPKVGLVGLGRDIEAIAARAQPGVLGVGLMNLESGQSYLLNAERPFPMMSVFKMLLGAAVLAEVDAGRMTLNERFFLLDEQLSPPFSPIAAAFPGRREYTATDLLTAAVVDSDNTAADVLMHRIGGPGALTAWLTGKRLKGLRVDRYEREMGPEAFGMASFRPAWSTEAGFSAARAAVPPPARMAAMRAFMADPRDTATPRGMLEFLQQLDRGDLISQPSTKLLLQLMGRTPRGAARLKAGLPKDAFVAHKPGTSGTDQGLSLAHNDVGVFTLADRRSYAICAFLSGSTQNDTGRDAILAQVAGACVRAIG